MMNNYEWVKNVAVFSLEHKTRNNECDICSYIKPSAVLNLFQDIAGAQCEQYRLDQSEIIKKGICWVIAKQHAVFERAPRFSETLLIETWPGKPMLSIMPRYYRISDTNGNTCVRGCAWWVLMNVETRAMASPSKYGVDIPWEETGYELKMPRKIPVYDSFSADSFRVPWSWCDINGHMNNIRYLDLCQDVLYNYVGNRPLTELTVEYSGEARIGDEIALDIGRSGSSYSVQGSCGKKIFAAHLNFGEA